MKIKLLTISALTLAVSALGHAQTDPFLFGLRAKLPSTERLKDPRIATLFEVWKDANGVLQSNGYLEMGFHFPTSTHTMVLNVRSVAQMSDASGALLYRGKGQLRDTTANTSRDCYVEWYGIDRRKQNQTGDGPNDAFAIHFWMPGTELEVSSRWEFPGFHQVEIYRPNAQ
jgi:hypothetical protein